MSSILPGTTRGPTYAQVFKKGASLRLLGGTSGTVDLISPAAPTSYTLTLPASLGASDKLIQVDSSGNMTLVDAPASTSPAGSGTEIQYRNGSAFGAVVGSSWDGTTLGITGRLALASGGTTVAIGLSFGTVASYATMVGVATSCASTGCAFGYDSQVTWDEGIAIGLSSRARGKCVAIGSEAVANNAANFPESVAIGADASAAFVGCVALGYGSTCTADSQLVCGSSTRPINNVYFGKGVTNATPTAWTLNGTGGSGSNVVGGNLVIAPGPSTGNATPSSVIIQSSVAGSSGSTAQTLADTLTVTNGVVESSGYIITANTHGYRIKTAAGDHAWFAFASNTNKLTIGSGYWIGGTQIGTGSGSDMTFVGGADGITELCRLKTTGRFGVLTTAPDRQVEINATDGNCLRLTYNDSNGSATYYTDFAVSAAGNLTITPSGTYIEFADAKDLAVGTTTGTKIGTATGQKLGFWNATPVVQQVLATGAGATVDNVISFLQTLGLCKQS